MQAPVLLAALALTAASGSIDGNGKIKQETRPIGDFRAISVGAGIQAKVTIGEKPSLTLEADENLLPLIETKLANGNLTVGTRKSIRPTKPIRLTVVARQLDAVKSSGGSRLQAVMTPGQQLAAEASGGADLFVEGVAADKVTLDVSGGAEAELIGKAKRIEAEFSGGAVVRAYELAAQTADVEGTGGGRIELDVSDELAGDASGGASIHLKRIPAKRSVSTSGGARVVLE